MSDIGLGLHTYLQTKSEVTSLVDTRGYPDVAPQNPVPPFYVYRVISYAPTDHTTGTAFAQSRVQVDCFGNTRTQAETLRSAVRSVTNNHRGSMGIEQVTGCTVEGKYDDYAPPTTGEKFGWFIHSIDLLISHSES